MDSINQAYALSSLQISNFEKEPESQEYQACRYKINELRIIARTAKITPKKIGQFVTCWKRNQEGVTMPFLEDDLFDFYIINVLSGNKVGQFIFPKHILIAKGIVSTKVKEGKRGFRLYPSWDLPTSNQAIKTQKWQLDYFVKFDDNLQSEKLSNLLELN